MNPFPLKKESLFFYLFFTTIFIIYSIILLRFVFSDSLSSFASDSANYMLMALYLSPWETAAPYIQSSWPYQDFPPFFPFILAITGVAHSIPASHLLTTAFLLIALLLLYFYTLHFKTNRWHAFFIVFLFALSPAVWMNTLGILSENLYLVLSLTILLLHPHLKRNDVKITVLFGMLLSALMLTRTIGISMFVAYTISGVFMLRNNDINKITYLAPLLIFILINCVVRLFNDSSIPSQYINQIENLNVHEQFFALIDAWFSSWQFYWVSKWDAPYIIVSILGLFAVFGLTIGIKRLRLDAIYISIYLLILLVWPHPGQALRFIYPVQPILLVFSFFFVLVFLKEYSSIPKNNTITIILVFLFTAVAPSLSYTWNRHEIGMHNGYQNIKEFYRFAKIETAALNANIQNIMFKDMEVIKNTTPLDSVILYFSPTYISLLANRHAEIIIFENNSADDFNVININDADYVYLSRIHPRKSKEEINGLEIEKYFNGHAERLWVRYSNVDNQPASMFLKINSHD